MAPRRTEENHVQVSRFPFWLVLLLGLLCDSLIWGGNPSSTYRVLNPISHGNLTIFPVVASTTHDTSEFITLDEGIRSGEIVITEGGGGGGLIRAPHPLPPPPGPRVNTLVLVNNSKHPLILLAERSSLEGSRTGLWPKTG